MKHLSVRTYGLIETLQSVASVIITKIVIGIA